MNTPRDRYEVGAVWGQGDNETSSLVDTANNKRDAFDKGEALYRRETLYHSGVIRTLVPRIQVSDRMARIGQAQTWEYDGHQKWRVTARR